MCRIREFGLLSLVPLLLVLGCSTDSSQESSTLDETSIETVVPVQINEYVSLYTSGEIKRSDEIRVVFARNAAASSLVGQPLDASPLTFSPAIVGTAAWQDVRTLIFKPSEPLKSGTAYAAELDMNAVFSDIPELLAEFSFSFRTIRRALDIQLDHLKTENGTDLSRQYLTGRIISSDQESADAVEKLINAKQDNRYLSIEWQHSADGKSHNFRFGDIERKTRASAIVVTWDGGSGFAEFKGRRTFTVPPLNSFSLLSVEAQTDPRQVVLLNFSDPLNVDQDLRGLIYTEQANLRLEIEGSQVKAWPDKRLVGDVELRIFSGIENVLGYKIQQEQKQNLRFEETQPQLRLVDNGVILPSTEGTLFPFEAVNLDRVDVQITKIFAGNIPQFLQVNYLDGQYDLRRVGRVVKSTTISLKDNQNLDLKRWNRHVLDLTELVETDPGALYRITLGFRHDYSQYTCFDGIQGVPQNQPEPLLNDSETTNWDYYSGYYDWRQRDNPCHRAYYGRNRTVSRNLLASDLGLIAKQDTDGGLRVFVTDLRTTEPQANVDVSFFDFHNQLLTTVTTDRNGMASASFHEDNSPFLTVAQRDGERGYLSLQQGIALNLSRFDVGGAQLKKGLNGYLYGERGVWRPGDTLHLTFVLNDPDGRLPANHPVILTLTDPRGRQTFREVATESLNGFYTFQPQTSPDAPTGRYMANVAVGGVTFNRPLKIETVMPNRLKIDMAVEGFASGAQSSGNLDVAWLHGAVARNLKSTVEMRLSATRTRFDTHNDFRFDDPSRSFYSDPETIFEGKIDAKGKASFPINVAWSGDAPGRLRASFTTRVFEPGGAFSIDSFSETYDPYAIYVGVNPPQGDDRRGMLMTDQDHTVEVVTLDQTGKAVPRQNLKADLYKLEWRWWWDQSADQVSNYQTSQLTSPVASGTLDTNAEGRGTWPMRVNYPEWGRYLLRVCDPGGHCTGKIVYIDWPGWAGRQRGQQPGADAVLTLSSDKDRYQVGETVTITIPTSEGGRALVSIESGDKVLKAEWLETSAGTTFYSFETTPGMAPNVYANVTLIQPHAQTANDLPIRLYGVTPVLVENVETRLEPILTLPETLQPNQSFEMSVAETQGRAMTYTIAVVDEGLLDLTRFTTPDPHGHFYARQALGVRSWDVYQYVLGALGGEIATSLSVGGGGELDPNENPKANRFEPVVRFLGPFDLAPGKTGQHTVDLPNYVGSVRTMVIAGHDGAFGSAEQTRPVREPLMLLGTLPRVLGPNEEVAFPLTVFAMEDHVREVELTIETNALLEVRGNKKRTIRFQENGDQLVTFPIGVAARTGIAKVTATARSGRESARFEIELDVRNPNPYITRVETMVIQPGDTWETQYQPIGMDGTNTAILELSSVPPINLAERAEYLIRYPHGCLEQTTSAAFAQLYLGKLIELPSHDLRRIEDNVRVAVRKIGGFQRIGGGLGYWPGAAEDHPWSTNYAGHFMLAAKELGYNLPPNFLERWLSHQRLKANAWNGGENWQARSQAYRLYLLAMAGHPQIGAMNRLRERSGIDNVSRWLLAGAYHRAGMTQPARSMATGLTTRFESYRELGRTFGSNLRDQAIVLDVMRTMELWTKAESVALLISEELVSERWHNTQALGFSIMAMAHYSAREEGALRYRLSTRNAETTRQKPFDQIPFNGDAVLPVAITNPGQTPLHARLVKRGQPLEGVNQNANQDLNMTVVFQDMEGKTINPGRIEQGTDFYALVTLVNPGRRGNYEEIALNRIFASGWEIHNDRLSNENPTGNQSPFSKPEYEDIRDDRAIAYFDQKRGEKLTFRVALNASYQGRFYLPPFMAEAMYDNTIHAHNAGRWVEITPGGGGN